MEVPSFLSPLAFEYGLCRVGRGVTVCVVVVRGCGSNYAHQESRTRITRCPDHQMTPYPTHPSAPRYSKVDVQLISHWCQNNISYKLRKSLLLGETGPILDSRGFSLIYPDPLGKTIFFTKVILYSCPHPLDFFQRCHFKIVEVTSISVFRFFLPTRGGIRQGPVPS